MFHLFAIILSILDFKDYDHFYFYNSFYENIEGTQKIDYNVHIPKNCTMLTIVIYIKQLNKKPAGTRLVTYHSFGSEIPKGYEVVQTEYDDYLKFWIKV